MKRKICLISCVFLLFGCATRTTPAPIVNVTTVPDYSETKPSAIHENSGTKLGSINQDEVKTAPIEKQTKPVQEDSKIVSAPALNNNSTWISPTDGSIIKKFTVASKGIDYTGKVGQSIVAINDGKVVYSGNGLKGYGNLIIIKHDKTYLSAYADNQNNLIKEGSVVKRGQKIATMGRDAFGKPLLHFEVRKNGKPIDPTLLIK